MDIKRYVCEEDGSIYDRKARRLIKVRQKRLIGNHYYINPESEDEIVICKDVIEEAK